MNIMVTGATGGYGSYAIDYLKQFAPEATIYGLVRSEAKGVDLRQKGVQVRVGDYADLNSMIQALKGIDRLLFVSYPTPGIQKNVVTAAKVNKVQYIAYTSIFQPDYAQFGLELNHKQTEQWIQESGIAHTFLRNSWYIDVLQALFDHAKKTREFTYFANQGQLSFALKREFAEAGAKVIAAGNYGSVVNLAGSPRTFEEIGQSTQQALGADIKIECVSATDFVPRLVATGIDQQWAEIAQTYQTYTLQGNNGENQADSAEFEQILGHPLTDLTTAIKASI